MGYETFGLATLISGPQVFGRLSWQLLLIGVGLALRSPVIPFRLELLALRRLTGAAFGTLMSVEPAIALLVGPIILGQVPHLFAGVLLVAAAGVDARTPSSRTEWNVPA